MNNLFSCSRETNYNEGLKHHRKVAMMKPTNNHHQPYHRPRIIVDSLGNLRHALCGTTASQSESEFSDDIKNTEKGHIFKLADSGKNKNIIENPAITLSELNCIKPKQAFVARAGRHNYLLVEVIREIHHFLKMFPEAKKELITRCEDKAYGIKYWEYSRPGRYGTPKDNKYLFMKQVADMRGTFRRRDSPNRRKDDSVVIDTPDRLGGRLYSYWLRDYMKITKRHEEYRKRILPLSYVPYRCKNRELDHPERDLALPEQKSDTNLTMSLLRKRMIHQILPTMTAETFLIYREPKNKGHKYARYFKIDRDLKVQHRNLPSYFLQSLRVAPKYRCDNWKHMKKCLKHQGPISKLRDKSSYNHQIKTGNVYWENEDLCEDYHSSVPSSYEKDNEPERHYTYEMAKQGGAYAYVNATEFYRKCPNRMSILFRVLLKKYLEQDRLRGDWEEKQELACERKTSLRRQMETVARNYERRSFTHPPQNWDLYKHLKSITKQRLTLLNRNNGSLYESPPTSDDEEELLFFRKHNFPSRNATKIKESGNVHFATKKGVLSRHKTSKKPENTCTKRVKRMSPYDIKKLAKLKQLRLFLLKRQRDLSRMEKRSKADFTSKRHCPFTHDQLILMCVGEGYAHYIGQLTRPDIILLLQAAQLFHKGDRINRTKETSYILHTIIPTIKTIISMNAKHKLMLLNSPSYGKKFEKKIKHEMALFNKKNKKIFVKDRTFKNTTTPLCPPTKIKTPGNVKRNPYIFIKKVLCRLRKFEKMSKQALNISLLRRKILKNCSFKTVFRSSHESNIVQILPTHDLMTNNTLHKKFLYHQFDYTEYAPKTNEISLRRIYQVARFRSKIHKLCLKRLLKSSDIAVRLSSLNLTTRAKKTFPKIMKLKVRNRSLIYTLKKMNQYHKLKGDLKYGKQRHEKLKSMIAHYKRLEVKKKCKKPKGRSQENKVQDLDAKNILKGNKSVRSDGAVRCDMTSKAKNQLPLFSTMVDQHPLLLRKTIRNRYQDLVHQFRDTMRFMKTGRKQIPRKGKKKSYKVLPSPGRYVTVCKMNNRRISTSVILWRNFIDRIHNIMNILKNIVEGMVNTKMEMSHPIYKKENSNTSNQCHYNRKLRILVNKKNKKVFGGYRSLKLGTDWTTKYHEIIQRKFIKIENFSKQKDSYVVQAGRFAAKGCEKVVKKCLYALKLFGISRCDLELALLLYGKLRIIVNSKQRLQFPYRFLLENDHLIKCEYRTNCETISKITNKMSGKCLNCTSWRHCHQIITQRPVVKESNNQKHVIEKYFYGINLRKTKDRKTIKENKLSDINDYKYYDYEADDDFTNKIDYSSDTSSDFKLECAFTSSPKNKPKPTDNLLHNLYRNVNNLKSSNVEFIMQTMYKSEKIPHWEFVLPSENDSSSDSYEAKCRKSYLRSLQDMKKNAIALKESNLRLQSKRREKRAKLLLRIRRGGEFLWRKAPRKIEADFEAYLNGKLLTLNYHCINKNLKTSDEREESAHGGINNENVNLISVIARVLKTENKKVDWKKLLLDRESSEKGSSRRLGDTLEVDRSLESEPSTKSDLSQAMEEVDHSLEFEPSTKSELSQGMEEVDYSMESQPIMKSELSQAMEEVEHSMESQPIMKSELSQAMEEVDYSMESQPIMKSELSQAMEEVEHSLESELYMKSVLSESMEEESKERSLSTTSDKYNSDTTTSQRSTLQQILKKAVRSFCRSFGKNKRSLVDEPVLNDTLKKIAEKTENIYPDEHSIFFNQTTAR